MLNLKRKLLITLLISSFSFILLAGCGEKNQSKSDMSVHTEESMVSDTSLQFSDSVSMGFSGGSESRPASEPSVTYNKTVATTADMYDVDMNRTEVESAPMDMDGGSTNNINNIILSERKIIRNAFLSIKVDNFETSYLKLKDLIANIGFIQETNIKKDIYTDNGKEKFVTYGTIVLRVDRSKFDDILIGVSSVGTVVDERISSNDVSDQFFDTESRIRLLKFEQEQLENYLVTLKKPEEIFKTQSRLTTLRHEIESLTGTLNKLSSLVDLSTIRISMSEPRDPDENPPKYNYWNEIFEALKESSKNVIYAIGEVVIFVVQAIPVVIVFGIIYFIIRPIYRKISSKRKLKKDSINDDSKNNNS
jgi:hypothetical protein